MFLILLGLNDQFSLKQNYGEYEENRNGSHKMNIVYLINKKLNQ